MSTGSVAGIVEHRCRGFTLVELLIALVILTVITVLLFSGLRLGSRAWDGVETVSDRTSELRIARSFIERSLRQAREMTLRFEGQPVLVFAGESDRLEFVAPLSANLGIPGLYILRLMLEEGGDGVQRLVVTRWLVHPDVLNGETDAPAWEPLMASTGFGSDGDDFDQNLAAGAHGRTLLLPEVGRFSVSYFGLAQGEQYPEWYDEWVDQRRLPYLVRLDLTSPDQSWPAAVIRLPGPGVIAEGL